MRKKKNKSAQSEVDRAKVRLAHQLRAAKAAAKYGVKTNVGNPNEKGAGGGQRGGSDSGWPPACNSTPVRRAIAMAKGNAGSAGKGSGGAAVGRTGTPGKGDDKAGIAGKGSDQRPASHMERPGASKGK